MHHKSKTYNLSSETSTQETLFRYWRIRIMYSMMIGYAGFYIIRQNLTVAMPFIEKELGYSKIQIGAIISIAAIVYGLGKGLSGLISDKSNARYFMAAGLFLSAIMNFFMGFGSHLTWFLIFWTLNNCFQSMGWPPCARLLTHWFSPKELATKWALWNCSQQIGGGIVLISAAFIIKSYGWRYAFYVPGCMAILLSFFLVNRLRDTPQSLGLPSIEEHHGLVLEAKEDEEHLSWSQILFERVMKNKLVWYVCFANFFIYIVRMTIFNWAPTFLEEFKGSSLEVAAFQTASYDVAGIFGGLLAGFLSDKVFNGYRGRVGVIFMGALGLAVLALWKSPEQATVLHFVLMMIIGFLISGPQILVGVAAADFASKKAAGTASGMTGTFGYIGAAVTGLGVGAIVENFGWNAAFALVVISALLGALCFALIWNHRSHVLNQEAAAKLKIIDSTTIEEPIVVHIK